MCIDWCYDSPFDITRWGDQKYLNRIPHLFSNIKVIDHNRIDAAPWNLVMKEENVHNHNDQIFINDSELVCFHFGSILILNKNKYELGKLEVLPFTESIINYIYKPYILSLQQIYGYVKKQNIVEDANDLLSNQPTNYTPKNIYKV